MKPIQPPQIINKGIAIYSPYLEGSIPGLLSISIYFSSTNPLFNWLSCDSTESLIWKNSSPPSKQGTLFLYEPKSDLELGFYRIELSLFKVNMLPVSGETRVAILTPTPYLIIGLPYSVYPPIVLT
ncbi:hypothetical protein H6G33_09285 [Calothrix sp. FACHB-1219]|uniref:hypothetical protein n=1 Tax=unclassified Calothrix TaxID=2619626 RepID=UPI001687D1C7|nr:MULTISPECIES: hypothetical protein [unclassified Calothrix]MBD2201538.1 hypothetical protein [Calothrix sp. FACHB-168]MBD2217224.1 hypothetical protein [Calothrix sp. FACHB-1219]